MTRYKQKQQASSGTPQLPLPLLSHTHTPPPLPYLPAGVQDREEGAQRRHDAHRGGRAEGAELLYGGAVHAVGQARDDDRANQTKVREGDARDVLRVQNKAYGCRKVRGILCCGREK